MARETIDLAVRNVSSEYLHLFIESEWTNEFTLLTLEKSAFSTKDGIEAFLLEKARLAFARFPTNDSNRLNGFLMLIHRAQNLERKLHYALQLLKEVQEADWNNVNFKCSYAAERSLQLRCSVPIFVELYKSRFSKNSKRLLQCWLEVLNYVRIESPFLRTDLARDLLLLLNCDDDDAIVLSRLAILIALKAMIKEQSVNPRRLLPFAAWNHEQRLRKFGHGVAVGLSEKEFEGALYKQRNKLEANKQHLTLDFFGEIVSLKLSIVVDAAARHSDSETSGRQEVRRTKSAEFISKYSQSYEFDFINTICHYINEAKVAKDSQAL